MSNDTIAVEFLGSVSKRLGRLKELGDGALDQLKEEEYYLAPSPESSPVSIILQHLHGNMISRWTDFLTTDGEKPTRDRDGEFIEQGLPVETLLGNWEAGWACMFHALGSLETDQLAQEVTIRGQKLTVLDAILRQMAHYGYHVGQIVYLARMHRDKDWRSLSIPKGQSRSYQSTPKD